MKRGTWEIFMTNNFFYPANVLLIFTILATSLAVARAQSPQDPSKADETEPQTVGMFQAPEIMDLLRDEVRIEDIVVDHNVKIFSRLNLPGLLKDGGGDLQRRRDHNFDLGKE